MEVDDAGQKRRHEYYLRNRAEIIKRSREWALKNPKRRKEINRDVFQRQRARGFSHDKDWAAKNPERWLEMKRRANRKRTLVAKERVFEILGRVCKRCGIGDVRVLCIDHVRGDGSKDRWWKNGQKRMHYEKYLEGVAKDKTGRYQILCHNCNWIKRVENREFSTGKRVAQGLLPES